MKIRLCKILVMALLFGLTVLAPVFAGAGKDKAGAVQAGQIADADSVRHHNLSAACEKGLFFRRELNQEE